MIFDTHCHLNDEKLLPRVDEVIKEAKEAGITRFLCVGWDKESSLNAIKLAEQYDEVYAAIGFHPENIFDVQDGDYEELAKYIDHPKVVAVGEIGLDFYWHKDPVERELQKEWFIKQILFANEHQKPIVIHARDANQETINILKEYTPKHGGVMHCYSGSVEMLKDVQKLGLFIGLDGPVTFKNAKTPKEVAEEVDINMLVVETDSPYLTPHPLRGTINEPKNLVLVVDEISNLKNMSKKHLLDVLYQNSNKLFNLK
ncbi:MAG: TatD family hydrolase [Bacilli bacterium]|nr:TatD family hydrolase [Bacilli bacterium]